MPLQDLASLLNHCEARLYRVEDCSKSCNKIGNTFATPWGDNPITSSSDGYDLSQNVGEDSKELRALWPRPAQVQSYGWLMFLQFSLERIAIFVWVRPSGGGGAMVFGS